jgi:hypothetical protein
MAKAIGVQGTGQTHRCLMWSLSQLGLEVLLQIKSSRSMS